MARLTEIHRQRGRVTRPYSVAKTGHTDPRGRVTLTQCQGHLPHSGQLRKCVRECDVSLIGC
jgi:hypothetical protein